MDHQVKAVVVIMDSKLVPAGVMHDVKERQAVALEQYVRSASQGLFACHVCRDPLLDPIIVRRHGASQVFAHENNFSEGSERRKTLVDWTQENAHLYWTSTGGRHSPATNSPTGFLTAGIPVELADAEEYRTRLNWKEATAAWKTARDNWDISGKKGVIPPLPLDILIDIDRWLSLLVALDVLLQGYMAIRTPESVFGPDHQRLLEQHHILAAGQKDMAIERTQFMLPLTEARQRLLRPWEGYQSRIPEEVAAEPQGPHHLGWYWLDECLPDVKEKKWSELAKAHPELLDKEAIAMIWRILRGECLGMTADGDSIVLKDEHPEWDQDRFTSLFARAHREYAALLEEQETKKRIDELESIRSPLTHNRIQNSLICVFADSQRNQSVMERCGFCFDAWKCYLDETLESRDGQAAARARSIRKAISEWPSIRKEIEDYFVREIPARGYQLSNSGRSLKQSTDECIRRVHLAIGTFFDYADKDEHAKEAFLTGLTKDLEELHDAMHKMKHRNDGRLLGGHVEDLCATKP